MKSSRIYKSQTRMWDFLQRSTDPIWTRLSSDTPCGIKKNRKTLENPEARSGGGASGGGGGTPLFLSRCVDLIHYFKRSHQYFDFMSHYFVLFCCQLEFISYFIT